MSLLVVGALHWDVVVGADRLPRLDETLNGHDVTYRLGGKGGNQAIAAARAGAAVAFAGRIGTDEPGQAMKAELEDAGVDVSQLQQGPGASGMSVAITVKDGGYGAVIVSAENLEIDADAVVLPKGCRMVLMQNEISLCALRMVASRARDANAQLWLNAAPATGLTPADLRLFDVIIVNRIEGSDLLGVAVEGLDAVEVVGGLQQIAPDAAIVLTLGGDGVAYAAPSRDVQVVPAHAVDVVSTHGAGDVFVGTMAAAMLSNRSFADAIADAQDASARHVSRIR